MELTVPADTEPSPPNPIRVETALSRYPVHRLARKGSIRIEVHEADERGEATLSWKVSHNSEYGQPGPLAYKLDTLVINRRIEEAPRPVPRIIRLGTHKEICEELGIADGGRTLRQQKNAFHQNASSYITARIKYRARDGTERNIEIGDTRYAVVFTGEKLPDGRRADAIHVVLHDFYREIIDQSITRPLDYDYLKGLSPAPQRLYELLSYQIYAALKHDRPRARLAYSEFCIHAPQARHAEWLRARTQMNKLHRPHLRSGYIAGVDFEATTDGDGRPDWIMLYTPGPKARAEYRTFARRGGPAVLEVEPIAAEPPPRLVAPGPSPTEAELIGRGVTPAMAAVLVREHGEEAVRAQVEHLDWLAGKRPGKIADPAAWLVAAIRDGHAPPEGFVSKAERQAREESRRVGERQEAESRRRRREEEARERAMREEIDAYLGRLTPVERSALEAEALADPEARRAYDEAAPARLRSALLRGLVRERVAARLAGGAAAGAQAGGSGRPSGRDV